MSIDKGKIGMLCEEKGILRDFLLEEVIQHCYRLSHKSNIPKCREKYFSEQKKDKNIEKLKNNCTVA